MFENIMNKFGSDKAKFREMEAEAKMHRLLEKKHMSPQERDMEKYLSAERNKQISKELTRVRANQTRKMWSYKMPVNKNVFHSPATILQQDRNVLYNSIPLMSISGGII